MKKYLFIAASSIFAVGCANHSTDKKQAAAIAPQPAAVLSFAVVQKNGLSTNLQLPGQLAAYEEVSIFPKVNGYVERVLVDIGDNVARGKLLMVLQAPELEQAVLQAKERYARNKATLSIDREQYHRYYEASLTAGAVSALDLSTLRAKMEADSALANAEKLNWETQQTMLGYLQVVAPFSGVITERNVHPGALVSAAAHDKPMLELKQIKRLRLQVDIPENVAGGLKDKDSVTFFVSAMPSKKMQAVINRVSMNMNTQYRSERMEIDVDNSDSRLSPGMYATVILNIKGAADALTVPASAVVTSTERKYVLLYNNKKIRKVDVRTGNEVAGKIEIFGSINAGDSVIVHATDEMSERN